MRAIAGALVILAGAILGAAAAVSAALPRAHTRSRGAEVDWATFGAVILIGFGVVVLVSYREKH